MFQASKGFQALRLRMKGQQSDNDGISTELGGQVNSTTMEDIQKLKQSHQFDPNLPQKHIDALRHAAESGDTEKAAAIEQNLTEDSPYPEVRAAVRNTDEELVANTVRAWMLGFFFITVGGGLNMFLSMR